jgi:tetratricopeptide (TPR) repeat protein
VKLKSLFSVISVTSSIASVSSLGICHPSFASNSHKLVRSEPAEALIISELISAKEYLDRGNAKYKSQDYQGAITGYEHVIALNPNYLNVADNLRKAKNTADRANAPTPNLSSSTPQKTAQYYEQQGVAKFKLKDYQGAIREFDRAIEIDPQSASAYEGRGTAKYLLNQSKAALPDLERAADLFRQQNNESRYQEVMSGVRQIKSEKYAQMGADKYSTGDHQGAIADCDRAIDINPKNASAYEIRGAAKYALKQRENAIRDLERAADLYHQLNNDQKYKEMVSLIGQFKAAR